jgi:glycosyltransferase involved in cell wall biosynthesis
MSLLVSVIIPVYNAEQFLKRCLNSIVHQTYSNIEILLVNDGSSDNSRAICDEYAINDQRVNVIHKENAGPSKAREDGINQSKGEYLIFVDADDYIDVNMIERMISVAEQGFDIVQCGFRKVTVNEELIETIRLKPTVVKGQKECATNYAAQKNTTNFLWNRIYRKNLFKDIEYPQLYAGEDSCLLTQLYASSEAITNIEDQLYSYVMTPESLCRQPFSYKRLGNVEAGKFMYNFYIENFPELASFSALHICSYSAKLYCDISQLTLNQKEEKMNYLLGTFREYYRKTKDNYARSKSSKNRVALIELFNLSPLLCRAFYSVIKDKL